MSDDESRFPPLDSLRREPRTDPAALDRLRAAIVREAGRGRSPRIVLTPASALLAAALIAVLTSAAWLTALPSLRATQAAGPSRSPVQFVLVAGDAERVALVGDFNDWDRQATPMARAGGGVWSVIVPLEPGRFAYAFLVDGEEWRADPSAIPASGDFGRPSSVVFVNAEADL